MSNITCKASCSRLVDFSTEARHATHFVRLACSEASGYCKSGIFMQPAAIFQASTKFKNHLIAKSVCNTDLIRKNICIPLRATFEAKDRGMTLQLNRLRDVLPPLHQKKTNPRTADDDLVSGSAYLTFFLLILFFEVARELATKREAEPIVLTKSTCFHQSAERAAGRKLVSSCKHSIRK